MANKRIDQLPPSGNDLKGTDLLAVWSDNKTERITLDAVAGYSGFTSENTFLTGGTFNDGTITLGDNSGNEINISGITSQDTFTTGATFNRGDVTLTDNNGGNVGVTINTDYYNTYFVSPNGDDSTGVRGDLFKPFKTISAARNKVVSEISASTVTGDTLIYVYPGQYEEAEIQYQNGNFYFSPGVELTTILPPSSATPDNYTLFKLGSSLEYHSNIYSATTCNVYGHVNVNIPRRFDTSSGWGGQVFDAQGDSTSYFEFDNIFVGGGNGFNVRDNSNVTVIGNEIKLDYTDYCFNFRGTSISRVEVNKITGGFDTFSYGVIYRDFDGISQFTVDELLSEPSWKSVGFVNINEGCDINFTAGVIRHTVYSAATDYPIAVDNMEGGIIRLNGTINALTGGIKTERSGGGIVEMNMDITSGLYPVTFQSSNNTVGHTFKYNGDFRLNDPNVTYGAFLLSDCVNYISGSISDLSGAGIGWGITANNPAVVNIGDLVIKDINNEVFKGSSTYNIEGSLYTEKEITGVSFNGQYQLLDKTVVDELQIRNLGTGTTVNNLGIDSNGNVVVGTDLVGDTSYWTSGSTGNYSIKQVNDTNLDALNNYSTAMGDTTISSGVTSISSGVYTLSNGVGSFAGGNNQDYTNNSNTSPTGGIYGQDITGITIDSNTYYIIASGEGSFAHGVSTAEGPLYVGPNSSGVGGVGSQVFGKDNVNTGNYTGVFGDSNYVKTSNYSLLYGRSNYLYSTATYPSNLMGGINNTLTGNSSNNIIHGNSNQVSIITDTIVGGRQNVVNNTAYSVINGYLNTVSVGNSLITGINNNLQGSHVLNVGSSNTSDIGTSYLFMLGDGNTISAEEFTNVINGSGNSILSGGDYSSILNGSNNTISSPYSTIINGVNNSITSGSRSVILGGQNITATNNDTVYTPNLEVTGREILSETVATGSTSGLTVDWSLSNNFEYTITTDVTISFSNDSNGQTLVMAIKQDGTGGHTVTWPSSVQWAAGGTEPTQTTTADVADVYTLVKINGTVYGSYIQNFT